MLVASVRSFLVIFLILAASAVCHAQDGDPRIADLLRSGKLRVGMFPPQFVKNASTGELSGWGIELTHALAARMRVQPVPIQYPGPDKLLEGLNTSAWDVGVLVNSPNWTQLVDFSNPFIQQDFTFLVPAGSAIHEAGDVDRPGVKIAVVRHHGSTLALNRILKQARAIEADTLEDAFSLLRNGKVDAYASTRPQLLEDSMRLPGSAVLEDRYGVNFSVFAVPKGSAPRLAYINEFIGEAKA